MAKEWWEDSALVAPEAKTQGNWWEESALVEAQKPPQEESEAV